MARTWHAIVFATTLRCFLTWLGTSFRWSSRVKHSPQWSHGESDLHDWVHSIKQEIPCLGQMRDLLLKCGKLPLGFVLAGCIGEKNKK